MHHIRNTLPDIKIRVAQQLQKYNTELQALGGPMGDANAGNVVLSVITEFCSEFRTTIDGNTNDLSLNELSGGARISFVFHELFNTGVKSIDPFDQVKDGDIRTILYNSSVSLSISSGKKQVETDGVYRAQLRHYSSEHKRSKSLSSSRSSDSRSQVSSAANWCMTSLFESSPKY
jgi:replication fork clamp-binding protein CrfC